MLQSLRARTSDEGGFTLIELLVVILIIGILSAIAIPAFLSQTSKANAAAAKTQVGTLQTTMESYATENGGSYENATQAKLEAIEPTLKDTTTAKVTAVTPSESGESFTVSSEVVANGTATGEVYTLKNTKGAISRTCAPVSKYGCASSGSW
jgi:type IV pilus assembly protein PilA